MRKVRNKFKKGAASFYIVAFSTLILMIVATSFAVVIISEIERTSNDDLSKSAYDSAMAGIEDAKVAIYSYQNCLIGTGGEECEEILQYMDGEDCNAISKILGRSTNQIIESGTDNNMQQSYTCVTIDNTLDDYRSEVTSKNTTKVMRAKFEGVSASQITKVRVSWFSNKNDMTTQYNNIKGNKVVFPGETTSTSTSVPPTISLAMLQTAKEFKMSDFDTKEGNNTDRGMVYLVPTDEVAVASSSAPNNYIGAYNGGSNTISAEGFAKSNDQTSRNLPYVVYCDKDGEFMCSTEIALPNPVNGERNDETFIFAVGLPYGEPDTDFSLEFLCNDIDCGLNREGEEYTSNRAFLENVQIEIDSTGRAYDLFRRVATRLEGKDDFTLSLGAPLSLFGDGNDGDALIKNFSVKCEYTYGQTCP